MRCGMVFYCFFLVVMRGKVLLVWHEWSQVIELFQVGLCFSRLFLFSSFRTRDLYRYNIFVQKNKNKVKQMQQ